MSDCQYQSYVIVEDFSKQKIRFKNFQVKSHDKLIFYFRYKMPTRRKITETVMEAYKLHVQHLKNELQQDADFVNITTDIWSSRNLGSYLGVTGQWASNEDGELKIRYLAVRSMSGSHTGENVDMYLKSVFSE